MESISRLIRNYVPCLGRHKPKASRGNRELMVYMNLDSMDEKAIYLGTRYGDNPVQPMAEDIAGHVFSVWQTSLDPAHDLKATVNNIVHQTWNWKERFAKSLLSIMERALIEKTILLESPMGEAYEKATRAAEGIIKGFVHDHPVWTAVIVIVIALGMLYLMMPVVLEILGFGELGPIEGMLAYQSPSQAGTVWLMNYRIICRALAIEVWGFRACEIALLLPSTLGHDVSLGDAGESNQCRRGLSALGEASSCIVRELFRVHYTGRVAEQSLDEIRRYTAILHAEREGIL